ncbi:MAG: fibronectin type III domain-containing protein, partial [Bacteroidales bacterium]|nr:fibronectin type III domain-containing protein [Bacteroidales bacterium]
MKKQLYLWLLAAAFLLPVTGRAQTPPTGVILIGDTSNMVVGSTHLPYESSTSSYTQQLVLRSELNGEAIITGIDLYCANPSTAGRGGCTIYLANTYVPRLDSMVHFGATFQAVAYNSLACTVGWNHYDFDSAFHYNGFGNLIVAFDCPWGIGSYGGGDFYCEQTQNSSRYDHTQLQYLSYSHTYGTPYRNVMRLHTQPVPPAVASCPPPSLWVDSLGADAVKLKWSPGYQDTSWTVECITDGDTAWRSSGLVWGDTSYTMTGLSPNTHYTFRLTAFCTSSSTTVLKHVLTNCTHAPLPYAENLESSWNMPSCWFTTAGTEGFFPGISSSYSHSPSRSVRLQGGAVVLPAFNAPPDSLELYFWAHSNGGSIRNLYV